MFKDVFPVKFTKNGGGLGGSLAGGSGTSGTTLLHLILSV